MKRKTRFATAGAAVGAIVGGALYVTGAIGQMGFGTEADVDYANRLWATLEDAHLVGDRVIHGTFYQGTEPHGAVLETLFADITMDGTTAPLVIKRNYGPAGADPAEVANDPTAHLGAITVMYQRPGFNPDNNDWFWVKFLPDGTLDLADGTPMAGNVGGCIACHQGAPGNDFIFTTDRPMHPAM